MTDRQEKKLSGSQLLSALEDVCRGLVYVSETDSSIIPFLAAGRVSPEEFVYAQYAGSKIPMTLRSPAKFFSKLTAARDWHTPVEKIRTDRFRRLEMLMDENLHDVKVVRVGRIRVDIFIVGSDREGNIIGVRTSSVET